MYAMLYVESWIGMDAIYGTKLIYSMLLKMHEGACRYYNII